MSPARLVLVAALAIACHGALAQTAVPPALAVQRLAPQLVAFAGSEANFQSLVTGLAQGTPVQLFSVLPNGFTQTVSFTPAAALSPGEIAQLLESARQQLIGLGIGNPTAEQIGFTLMGGVVPTALGGTQVAGVLNGRNPPSPAAQIQAGGAAAGATAAATTPAVTSAVNVQLVPGASPATATSATAPRQTSDSLTPAGATSRSPAASTSATPTVPTAPIPAPGAGSTPPTAERVPPGTPPARN